MIKKIRTHLVQYFILLAILGLGLISFILTAGQRQLQFRIVILTSSLYVVWGLVHHFLEKTLYLKIVIEYIAVAILAIIILRGLLL